MNCPAWCQRHGLNEDGAVIAHQRPVGDLGVMIECPPEGETVIYVPELDRAMEDSATPAFAARLAGDLLMAAVVAQGGRLVAS